MNDTHRGHLIKPDADLCWIYADTGQLVCDDPVRECGACGMPNTPDGHDGCLGTLPGVMNACCGHGELDAAYVQFEDGVRLGGSEAVDVFKKICKKTNKM